jgi:hypothetical protein
MKFENTATRRYITTKNMKFLIACFLIVAGEGIYAFQLSMVASRAPFSGGRRQQQYGDSTATTQRNNNYGIRQQQQQSSSTSVTSTLISNLACMALKRRLKDQTHVSCDLVADSNALLFGRVGPVTVKGRGWQSSLGLTCRAIEATVDECKLDMARVITNQKLVLTTPGTLIVVFLSFLVMAYKQTYSHNIAFHTLNNHSRR